MGDKLIEAIREAVTVRPDDTLVLRVDPSISVDEVEEIGEQLRKHLPEGVKTLVVVAEQIACVRDGEDLAS